jgi:hypothetical protein
MNSEVTLGLLGVTGTDYYLVPGAQGVGTNGAGMTTKTGLGWGKEGMLSF